jgi:NADH:ubiquinone oxidoreductase subunit F (NADH-binding)
VANADESEPGTFKDREILELNPYQFIEGLMIASYAVQAHDSYVYFRGEFAQIAHKFEERLQELTSKGLLGDKIFGSDYSLRLHPHLGAERTFAVKRPRCLNQSKASSANRACARLSRRWWACSTSRR